MNLKRACATLRDKLLYLEPEGREKESWMWAFIGDVIVMPWPISDVELGMAMLQALAQSKWDIPKQQRTSKIGRVAEMAGFKTWPAFAKEAKIVTILQDQDKGVEFYPTSWEGPRNGHAIAEDLTFFAASMSPQDLGAGLKKALDLCS